MLRDLVRFIDKCLLLDFFKVAVLRVKERGNEQFLL